jgi:hypothetical protein
MQPLSGDDLKDYEREIRLSFLEEARTTAQESAKTVLTLATGALAISVAFYKDIAGETPRFTWCLGLSWLCFLVSIICVMVGYQCRFSNLRLWRLYLSGAKVEKPSYRRGQVLRFLVLASMISFVLGAALVAVFAYVNLPTAPTPT